MCEICKQQKDFGSVFLKLEGFCFVCLVCQHAIVATVMSKENAEILDTVKEFRP